MDYALLGDRLKKSKPNDSLGFWIKFWIISGLYIKIRLIINIFLYYICIIIVNIYKFIWSLYLL